MVNKMPKLLQINVCSNVLSTGKITEDIAKVAQRSGWETYVAYGRHHRKSISHEIKIGTMVDVLLHYAEHRLLDHEGWGSRRATKKFIEQMKEINPDVIHLHNIHDHYLNYPLLFDYLRELNVPIVWTLHDCWAFTGGCYHYDINNCQKWTNECVSCLHCKNLLDKAYKHFLKKKELFTLIKKLTLVPVSRWLEGEVRKSFLKDKNIHTILNGIDLNMFRPINDKNIRDKYGIGSKFLLVALATSWTERKSFKDYIALSKLLPKDCVIMLIGLKQKQITQLPKNMIGIQRTDNIDDLVAIYSTADVVLNLSLEETFGLTSAEGYACGTPTIVYNCTASPELISSETGFVVEKGNLNGVIRAIEKIRENGKASYVDACRARARALYDKDKCFEKYVELYNELLIKK